MNTNFFILPQTVHLWRVFLPDLWDKVPEYLIYLNDEERQRAERFKFDHHRYRYVLARAILRQILSLYTEVPATDICFTQGVHGKPYLKHDSSALQFNLSHSHDMAVYAFTKGCEIGVDIEKSESDFSDRVAQRFFSEEEYQDLSLLSGTEKVLAFYRLWAAKEALIKVFGESILSALRMATICPSQQAQSLAIEYQQREYTCHLEYFSAHPEYQSAFALTHPVKTLSYWDWGTQGPTLWAP